MQCIYCGTCCRNGPPGLHLEDAVLYSHGVLDKSLLLTLRRGEPVWDNVAGRVVTLPQEMVRLKSDPASGACILLQGENHCRIYERRPAQCRALKCWDTGDLERIYSQNRAGRLDLVPPDSALAEIIGEHERRCFLPDVQEIVRQLREEAGSGAAADSIGSVLYRDRWFRDYLRDHAGAGEDVLHFVLGAPLEDILQRMGIVPEATDDGLRLREMRPVS
ncbi:MAG: YkgJ family cysteine cluster protein [Desulfohalobiaceae bacterium]|nr:YkgJ family cysteine cluster protein [Desulfohalobiaceae bacterium]